MSKVLTEADGPGWREKLPDLPSVPLGVRERLAQQARQSASTPTNTPTTTQQHNGGRGLAGNQATAHTEEAISLSLSIALY